jgi:hypothetical protein
MLSCPDFFDFVRHCLIIDKSKAGLDLCKSLFLQNTMRLSDYFDSSLFTSFAFLHFFLNHIFPFFF